MNKEISSFIDRYVKEIKNNSAAMFIGAGFSKSAGYVDWKNLLKDVADDLELDIDKEYDLVSLAQYCYNKNGNRNPEQWHCDKCKTYDWLNGSYITFVEEETFLDDPEKYINNAYDKSENDASGYDLVKQR